MTVAITRTEHTAADLRRLAGGSDDAAVARRLLALALIPRNSLCEFAGTAKSAPTRRGWLAETATPFAAETGKPCAAGCIATTLMA